MDEFSRFHCPLAILSCRLSCRHQPWQYAGLQFLWHRTKRTIHPVEGIKAGITSPSLTNLTTSSIVKCTDCHNNDTGPGNGGTGPKGPHGSANHQLLERNLSYLDNIAYVSANGALCFKCHLETTVFNNSLNFPAHTLHSSGAARTSCVTCHDPHGVATQAQWIWVAPVAVDAQGALCQDRPNE